MLYYVFGKCISINPVKPSAINQNELIGFTTTVLLQKKPHATSL